MHWFSTDAFLGAFAEVYFAGQRCRIGSYRLAGHTYRLLSPPGRPPVTTWTFLDFIAPADAPGPAAQIRCLPHAVLDTFPLGEEKPALVPGTEPAPFIRWERFPDWPSFEAHFVRRRSSLPRDSRQKRRNIEKDIGPLRFAWEDGRPEVFDQCYAWKSAQYDRTSVVDHFAIERNRELFRRLHARGNLVVSTLTGGDQLLAVHFGGIADGCVYSWIAAYDPARGRYSPGRLLLEDMLRESQARGHGEWDFGIGDADYKWHYASDIRVIGALGNRSLASRLGTAARTRLKPVLQRHPVVFEAARRVRKSLLDVRNAVRGGPAMTEATKSSTSGTNGGSTAAAPAPVRPNELVQLGVGCQLESFPADLEGGPPSRKEPWSWYLRRRSRHVFIKLRRLALRIVGRGPAPVAPSPALPAPELEVGDLVRVRSAEYVRSTLDASGGYRGCGFGSGMFQYCGKEFRVVKVVGRFFDEGRGRMLKSRNMVLLDGIHCDGSSSPDTLGCDRMCFYFWRNEWLEKVEAAPERREAAHAEVSA